jgi:hypothetical protein
MFHICSYAAALKEKPECPVPSKPVRLPLRAVRDRSDRSARRLIGGPKIILSQESVTTLWEVPIRYQEWKEMKAIFDAIRARERVPDDRVTRI